MGEGIQQPMSPADAVEVLRLSANKLNHNIDDWDIVLCSDMGTDSQRINYGSLNHISAIESGGIHCMVVPGRLDDLEQEALARWKT